MNAETGHKSMRNTYLAVFAALAVLTAVTVGVSYLHMARPRAIAVGVAIAALKVSLIVYFFMHMKSEGRIIRWLMVGALCIALILLFFILPDLGWSCPVCFGGEGSAMAKGFTWGILLLLALPAGLFGFVAFMIARSVRRKNGISGSPSSPTPSHPASA